MAFLKQSDPEVGSFYELHKCRQKSSLTINYDIHVINQHIAILSQTNSTNQPALFSF